MILQIFILSICTLLLTWKMYELDKTFKRFRRVHYFTGKYLYDPLMPYIKEAEVLECVIQQRFLCFWFTIKKHQIINLNND